MSDPMNPVAPARTRPNTVTISSLLLLLVVALELVGIIVALSAMGRIADVYEEAYQGTDLEGSGETIAAASAIGLSVFWLLVAAGLVVLAIFNNRGKNAARIITWVVGGLALCCNGFGLLGQLAGNAMNFGGGGDNVPDPKEIQDRINDAVPYYMPTAVAVSVLVVLAMAVALILLALPPSNEFFRKPQPVWEPPVPGYPGYQAQPGYPPAQQPGYPPAQQPGYPPAAPSDQPPGPPPGPPTDQPPAAPPGTPTS